MTISIITTITRPEERQDNWKEAIACYLDLANEVVVVYGDKGDKELLDRHFSDYRNIKFVYVPWPYEWNWIELPRHLNAGLAECNSDWVMRCDIDFFISKEMFWMLKEQLGRVPDNIDVLSISKFNAIYGGRYLMKGSIPIVFRNGVGIGFGEILGEDTDLCYPVRVKSHRVVGEDYMLPVGDRPGTMRSGVQFWNYGYFFKTKDFTRKEFFRMSRAWNRFFGNWEFGNTERGAFKYFMNMERERYDMAKPCSLEMHPECIREVVSKLTPEQFGYDGWGLLKE